MSGAAVFLLVRLCTAGACETTELPWSGTLLSCLMQGQTAIAMQVQHMPGTTVERATCVEGRPA